MTEEDYEPEGGDLPSQVRGSSNLVKDLRKQLKAQRRALDEAQRELRSLKGREAIEAVHEASEAQSTADAIERLREQGKQARQYERQQQQGREAEPAANVAQVLDDLGLDRRYAKYAPSSNMDEDAVREWVRSDGDLFGYRPDDISSEEAAKVEALENAVNAAPVRIAPPPLQRVRNAKTRQEFLSALREAGVRL